MVYCDSVLLLMGLVMVIMRYSLHRHRVLLISTALLMLIMILSSYIRHEGIILDSLLISREVSMCI